MEPPKDGNLLNQIFSQKSAVLLLFGALGGAVRAVALRSGLWELVRIVFIGSATAFGFGEFLMPLILKNWFGKIPDSLTDTLGVLTAGGFVTGLTAVVIMERLLEGGKNVTKTKDNS